MKLVQLIMYLCLSITIAHAQRYVDSYRGSVPTRAQNGQEKLQLTTRIVKQTYCSEADLTTLHWTLELTYTNIGDQTLLLDKKSSLIYRLMVSRNIKEAAAKRYEYDLSSSFITSTDLSKAGMRNNVPMKDSFIKLGPGESYSLEKDYGVDLYDGTKDSEEFVHPGNHFLQIRVATWYYFVQPEIYREQWRGIGYLWSQNMTSMPMPFIVEEKRTVLKCS